MKRLAVLRPFLSFPPDSPVRPGALAALLTVGALASLVPAFLHRALFDRILPGARAVMLPRFLLALLAAEAAGTILRLASGRSLAKLGRDGRHRLRRRLARRLWRLPAEWFDGNAPGTVQRHLDDAGRLGELPTVLLRDIVRPALMLALVLPVLFWIHPALALLKLAAVPPALAMGGRFLRRDMDLERESWLLRGRIGTAAVQGTAGIGTLKTGRGEASFGRMLHALYGDLGGLEERRRRLQAAWDALSGSLARSGRALSTVLAVALIIEGRLSFGAYIAFSILGGQAASAMGELFGGLRGLSKAVNPALRHRELYAVAEESPGEAAAERPGPQDARRAGRPGRRPLLDVVDVGFRYPSGKRVLDGLRLGIEDGERVLLSGTSGAGKSTLAALILGFRRPTSGRILWSGEDSVSWDPARRRRDIGAILQRPAFFDGSVRDNLCLFRPPPSDGRLWDALEEAGCRDVVRGLAGGLDARLGTGGASLSGGQLQRLALARLFLCPPRLVILDEATNALDPASAARVREGLARACRGRAVLAVAHGGPPPVVPHRTVVLEGGRLVPSGTGGRS